MPSHSSRDTSTSPDSWYSLWSLIWVSQPPRPQLFQSRQKNGLTYRRLDLRKVALPPLFKQMVDECRGKVLLRYEFFDLKEYLKGLVGRCPGVILTGDVGVGKSLFILYILFERLLAQEPTILQLSTNSIIVFQADGVYRTDGLGVESFLTDKTWVLFDSDPSNTYLCPELWQAPSSTFILQTTSSSLKVWEECQHIRRTSLVVMKPWNWDEILVAWRHFNWIKPSTSLETRLRCMYLAYGPNPRTCIDITANPSQEIMHSRTTIKISPTRRTTDAFARAATTSSLDAVNDIVECCRGLFIVRPDDMRLPIFEPVSAHLLADQMALGDLGSNTNVYRTISRNRHFHFPAAELFEAYMHATIVTRQPFKAEVCSVPHMESALSITIEFDQTYLDLITYSDILDMVQKLKDPTTVGRYMKPLTKTFPTPDAVAFVNDNFYLFRISVDPSSPDTEQTDVKPYVDEFCRNVLRGVPLDVYLPVYLIWVVPEQKIDGIVRRYSLYSSGIGWLKQCVWTFPLP